MNIPVLSEIGGLILQLIDTVFIMANGLVYDFIGFLYQIYIVLSSAQIFTAATMQEVTNRVYMVVGVAALFLVAYALLRAIIDPDSGGKDYSVNKVVPNIIKVVVLIAIVPVAFSYAFRAQEVIFSTDVMKNIVFGNDENKDGEQVFEVETAGRKLAITAFTAFLHPATNPENNEPYAESDIEITNCFASSCQKSETKPYTFQQAKEEVLDGDKNFSVFANFASLIHSDGKSNEPAKLEYNGIFQLIAGIFLVYVFFNFCIDMGVRAVKLGYYQIIAPIPILTLLLPGQKKVFENWRNYTISTFIDVFIRIFALLIGLFAINHLPSINDIDKSSILAGNNNVLTFARIFLILGIVLFIKQAPKLLEDLLGIKSGSFKLGIKDKLSEIPLVGGAISDTLGKAQGAATGAAGAAWTRGMDNLRHKKSFTEGAAQGAKYGAAAGWKAGGRKTGNQFNAQRQGIWSGPMGGKGTVSWLGGQAKDEKIAEDVMNRFRDDYRDRVLSAKINKYEDIRDPKSQIHGYYESEKTSILSEKQEEVKKLRSEKDTKTQEYEDAKRTYDKMFDPARNQFEVDKNARLQMTNAELSRIYDTRRQNLNSASVAFEADKNSRLQDVNSRISSLGSENLQNLVSARASFDANKKNQINMLENELGRQKTLFDQQKAATISQMEADLNRYQSDGNIDEANRMIDKISNVRASKYDDSQIRNQIQEIRNTKFENTAEYRNATNTINAEERKMFEEYNSIANATFEQSAYYQNVVNASKVEEEKVKERYDAIKNEKFEESNAYKAIEADDHTVSAKKNLKEREEHIKSLADQIKKDERILDQTIKDKNIIQHVYKDGKLREMIYDPNFDPKNAKSGQTQYFDATDPDYEIRKEAAKVSDLEYEAYEAAKKILRDRNETYKQEEKEHKKRINEKANEEWKNTTDAQRQILAYSEAFKKANIKDDGSKGGKDDKKE